VLQQLVASHAFQLQLMPAQLTALMMLLKVSATVTDNTGHHHTLFFLPGIICLFIMCIEII